MTDQDRPRSRSRSPERRNDDAPASNGGGGDAPAEDPVKLYLGNLDYNTDETRLRDEFSRYGSVTDVFLPVDRDSGRVRGFGFVTLSTRSAAQKAIEDMDGKELDGRTIRVNESRPRGERDGPKGFNASGAPDVKLFVGNLSFETDTEKLRSIFEKFGEVQDCYMPTDRDSGRPRGFAFVTMPAKDAEDAMNKMDGDEVDGRNIRVNEAMAKRDSGFGGRGGGDRGGYGGDRGGYGGDRGGYGGDRGGYGGDRGGYGGDRGGYGGDRGGYDRGGDRYGGGGDRYGDRGGDRDYDDRRGGRW